MSKKETKTNKEVHQIELELQNAELVDTKEKLEESHQEYLDLFNFAPVGYLLLDKDGIIKNANNTISDLLNKSIYKLKGDNFHNYLADNDKDKFYLFLKKLYKTEKIVETEVELDIYKPYTPCYVLLSGHVFPSTKNNFCRISVTNISEKVKTEIKLKENETRLKHAQEIGSLGYWSIESNKNTFIWSDIIYKMFQRNVEIGPPTIEEFLDCCHPDHRKMLKEKFMSALKYKEPFKTDFKVILGDNTVKCFTATGKPVVENEKVVRVEGIIQDITERKKLEQELRESNATKDKFFSIISHDLKGPLNIIIGMSKLLSQKTENKNYKDYDELVNFIRESSQQTMNLLENLLTWARSQTGRLEFQPRPVLINDIVENKIRLLKGAWKEKNLKINNQVPEELKINADPNMMRSVFRNLLSNAIKFSYEGGEINISAEEKKDEIFITIQDFGTGIKPYNFERLFQIDKTFSVDGTKDERGTGLGLILCKEFIEKHEGKIEVESEDGKGSIFNITLPKKSNNKKAD